MAQANPISQIVLLRRENWSIGLLNAAQFSNQDAAMHAVQASQCDRDDCEFCNEGNIPPASQGPAVVSPARYYDKVVKAPFSITMTPEKIQLRARCLAHPDYVQRPWQELNKTDVALVFEHSLYDDRSLFLRNWQALIDGMGIEGCRFGGDVHVFNGVQAWIFLNWGLSAKFTTAQLYPGQVFAEFILSRQERDTRMDDWIA